MIHITKKLCGISKKTLILSKVRTLFINCNIFANIISQGYQPASSHNHQFIRYYINSALCCYEIYISTGSPSLNKLYGNIRYIINKLIADNNICYSDKIKLSTEEEVSTGNPCFIKPNNTFLISPSIDVTYIYMFLCNIVELYMNCERIRYCPRFKQHNITYGFYVDEQVPYFLYLIYFLKILVKILVKLCAISTSLNHIIDTMSNISFLDLYTYAYKLADIMELIIIIHTDILYIKAELYCHKNTVLAKDLDVFICINCNCFFGNLLITINIFVINFYTLMQNNNYYVR